TYGDRPYVDLPGLAALCRVRAIRHLWPFTPSFCRARHETERADGSRGAARLLERVGYGIGDVQVERRNHDESQKRHKGVRDRRELGDISVIRPSAAATHPLVDGDQYMTPVER